VAHETKRFTIPDTVFGPTEVRRLARELDALEEYLTQARLRQSGEAQAALPRTSHLLETLAEENRLNLLKREDRESLAGFLRNLTKHAPVLHISFASDPSAAFTAKIVSWLRQHIHPHTLLRVGLQPTIVAGCTVRTNNKWFDFSLRHRFAESQKLLIEALEKENPAPASPEAAPASPSAAQPPQGAPHE
jgi:F0F1-type ATP synthase delta subunit